MDLPSLFKKKEEYHSAQSDSCPWSGECGTEGHKQKVRDGKRCLSKCHYSEVGREEGSSQRAWSLNSWAIRPCSSHGKVSWRNCHDAGEWKAKDVTKARLSGQGQLEESREWWWGGEKRKGMWATDFKTHWELTMQQTLVALLSASQEVEAFLASNHVSLSPVQVHPSQKNNYPLLHTHYVLCVLSMLLPVHVIILRSRKCHGADFAEEETQTQTIKGLSRMPETVICYSWNLVSGCPRSATLWSLQSWVRGGRSKA